MNHKNQSDVAVQCRELMYVVMRARDQFVASYPSMYQPQPDSGTIGSFTIAGYTPQFPTNYAPTPPVAGAIPFLAFGPAATAVGGLDVQPSAKPQAIPPIPEPDVTPRIAAKAIQKLVSVELKQVGFEKGDPTAVRRLEYEVQACAFPL